MYHCSFESPVGILLLESNGEALTGLSFTEQPVQEDQPDLDIFINTRQQLHEYFYGERTVFDIPLAFDGTDFQQKVWNELLNIPYGTSLSYKHLSQRLGDVKAIRAVGTTNGKNKIAIIVPCHRVLGNDGSLTGYAWGLEKKKWLLQHEDHPNFRQEQLSMF
ncbi:MAG: methylated-DNA--[protein]-cysteine S-methyltransferase [Cyclobacteriaceae bacterium]